MTGITLTYALGRLGCESLMELQMGWSKIDATLILKAVRILINFCHPEAVILKKLVEGYPRSTWGSSRVLGIRLGHLSPGPGGCIDSISTSSGSR